MQVLDDHGGGAAAAVADADAADLGVPLLEDGGDDAGAGAAEGVADGDGAAVDVDLFGVDAEDLHVGEGDDGEGLVDLVEVDVLGLEAGVLDGLGDGEGGGDGEALGLALGVAPAEDLGDGLEAELLELGLGDEDDGGGAVVDGGGVGGGDGAVRLEGGPHGLELGLVEVLDLVVAVDDDVGLAAAARHLDGDDLLEEAGLGGGLGLLVRVDGVVVLVLAGEAVVRGAELALQAHVLLLVGVRQAVLEDAVDEGLVTVLGAVAEVGQVVGRVGHGLGAAGDDDGRGAEHDVLGAQLDGLEGRGADLVHRRGDGGLGEAGADGALAGGTLAEAINRG